MRSTITTLPPSAARGEAEARPARPPAALAVRPALAIDAVPLEFFFDTMLRRDYFMRRGQLADILRSTRHRVYVAEIDAILVGVAIVTQGTRLVNALVHPAYRGLGIGRALVEYTGATEVRAKLNMRSGDPRGFYEAVGFRTVERVRGKEHIELMRRAPTGRNRRRAC